jgi:phosphocarrier protein HPr
MITKNIKISFEEGLHARPAMDFCQTAMKYQSKIIIGKEGEYYEAKSILSVLCMGAIKGDEIELKIEGTDEQEAYQAIVKILEKK